MERDDHGSPSAEARKRAREALADPMEPGQPALEDRVAHAIDAAVAQSEERRQLAESALARVSRDRSPFHLLPAIDAYAAGAISNGKLRECIRRWLAGANFRDPAQRGWEAKNSELGPDGWRPSKPIGKPVGRVRVRIGFWLERQLRRLGVMGGRNA